MSRAAYCIFWRSLPAPFGLFPPYRVLSCSASFLLSSTPRLFGGPTRVLTTTTTPARPPAHLSVCLAYQSPPARGWCAAQQPTCIQSSMPCQIRSSHTPFHPASIQQRHELAAWCVGFQAWPSIASCTISHGSTLSCARAPATSSSIYRIRIPIRSSIRRGLITVFSAIIACLGPIPSRNIVWQHDPAPFSNSDTPPANDL
ncbi:hypothetical protein BV20DRAFT_283219 [Pilatotrama ljubarskyi]|nr:hypothetical protein BV20DRAFT_283219 [Pilatotrama ljubarskyi]